jgi:2-iminobutanoate/2-iminopropanoate deaminase
LETTADIEMEFSAFREDKKYINTGKGHLPSGPFSQAVVIENYVHCSGVRPLDPVTQNLINGDFKQQIRQCLENLKVVLEASGTNLEKAYSFMVYLKELERLPLVEEVFQEYFTEKANISQEVTQINQLNQNHDIEISCSEYLHEQ